MSAHAYLSASGAHRWMACAASPRIEANYPDTTTVYAEEGTKAHELAEKVLRRWLKRGKLNYTPTEKKNYPAEMQAYVMKYCEYVAERAAAAGPDKMVAIEVRLDFSEYVPGGYGTGDAVIVSDNSIEVIDLKYGQGVAVSAENNPQLRLYGLGALYMYGLFYAPKNIRLHIVQPRLDAISVSEMEIPDLYAWGRDEVAPRAKAALLPDAPATPGDHCRFCKAKGKCKANADFYTVKVEEFKPKYDAGLMTPDEVAAVLDIADAAVKFFKAVKDEALTDALNGEPPPGYKAVHGTSRRKIVDHEAAGQALEAAGLDPATIFKEPELKGLTDLTKLVKPLGVSLEEVLGDLIEKPEGAPTLVPVSDKRPEIKGPTVEEFN